MSQYYWFYCIVYQTYDTSNRSRWFWNITLINILETLKQVQVKHEILKFVSLSHWKTGSLVSVLDAGPSMANSCTQCGRCTTGTLASWEMCRSHSNAWDEATELLFVLATSDLQQKKMDLKSNSDHMNFELNIYLNS